jgi:para-aminobenzoate synthetase component 1
MLIKLIDTELTSYEIFTLFQNRKNCFFLDSSMQHERLGRYSFIGFEPEISFKSKNGNIAIINRNTKASLNGDPFEELKLKNTRQAIRVTYHLQVVQ